MQVQNYLRAKPPTISLVSLGTVRVSIAQHDFSHFERRLDDFFHVLSAIGKHQRELRDGRKTGGSGIEQNRTNVLADCAATGLACSQNIQAASPKILCQARKLGSLPTAIQALKGNENAAP
jgi:hypothetical protein